MIADQVTRKPFASAFSVEDIPERVRLRFWGNTDQPAHDDCWPWKLSTGSHGYGQMGWQDGEKHQCVLAHRIAYVMAVGPIPEGMTVDHLCRNRPCCNPRHLRLLDNISNATDNGASRRTHCPQGHPYDETNTYIYPVTGHRQCRQCARERRK